MKHPYITNVEELILLMDSEAERWGRTESDNATCNGAGIALQWEKMAELDDWPYMRFGLIKQPTDVFELVGFWMNEEGQRVERPAEKLAKLAAEQDDA